MRRLFIEILTFAMKSIVAVIYFGLTILFIASVISVFVDTNKIKSNIYNKTDTSSNIAQSESEDRDKYQRFGKGQLNADQLPLEVPHNNGTESKKYRNFDEFAESVLKKHASEFSESKKYRNFDEFAESALKKHVPEFAETLKPKYHFEDNKKPFEIVNPKSLREEKI